MLSRRCHGRIDGGADKDDPCREAPSFSRQLDHGPGPHGQPRQPLLGDVDPGPERFPGHDAKQRGAFGVIAHPLPHDGPPFDDDPVEGCHHLASFQGGLHERRLGGGAPTRGLGAEQLLRRDHLLFGQRPHAVVVRLRQPLLLLRHLELVIRCFRLDTREHLTLPHRAAPVHEHPLDHARPARGDADIVLDVKAGLIGLL